MITAALCTSFKKELLSMDIHRPDDEYKIALYKASAALHKGTKKYTDSGEVDQGGGYQPGGQVLEGFRVSVDKDVAILDWTRDPVWMSSSITARGALIYNASQGNRAVAVLKFDEDISSVNAAFLVQLPPATAEEGLIRF